MRTREYYWSLYNTAESNQLDNLRTDQVEAVYSAIPQRTLNEWLIWRDGFEVWKPFVDFPQLLISLRKVEQQVHILPPQPPRPVMKKAPKQSEETIQTQSDVVNLREDSQKGFDLAPGDNIKLSFEEISSSEERNNFRFNKDFDVRLIAGSQIYQNRTVNVSLKGMQLAHPVPAHLPSYFNVEIRHHDQMIQMVCSSVKNPDGTPTNRIKIEVNDFTPGLLAILLAA